MSESQTKFEKALYYIDEWDAMSLACKVKMFPGILL